MDADDLAERRLKTVRTHMAAENNHDFETALSTFAHPCYELIGTGQRFDGPEEVSAYYRQSRAAFPDQRNELISLRHVDDVVIAEFWLLGAHLGPLATPNGELAPTGKSFRTRMCAFFEFDDDKIVCERIYFDRMSILEQLTSG
jgi:steroid delta-isomerase-like uncharacterized protein